VPSSVILVPCTSLLCITSGSIRAAWHTVCCLLSSLMVPSRPAHLPQAGHWMLDAGYASGLLPGLWCSSSLFHGLVGSSVTLDIVGCRSCVVWDIDAIVMFFLFPLSSFCYAYHINSFTVSLVALLPLISLMLFMCCMRYWCHSMFFFCFLCARSVMLIISTLSQSCW